MAKIDTLVIMQKVENIKSHLENMALTNSHNSLDNRRELIKKIKDELGEMFMNSYEETSIDQTYTYNFIQACMNYLDKIPSKIEFFKNWNENKFNDGKKIGEYFTKVNYVPNWSDTSPMIYETFMTYYKNHSKYDENSIIDPETYDRIMNSTLVTRFKNAFSRDAKYIPGEFVNIKLGVMPWRVIANLPSHSRNYIDVNKSSDLTSPGIILDVVDDKKIEVKNKGRWYKVAVATPFAIFCVEERHLRKYAPTKEYVEELYNESIKMNSKEISK